MRLFPHPPSFFPDRVTLLPLAEGVDGDAAPLETFPVIDPDAELTPCRVRLLSTRSTYAGEGETGTTTAEVAFPSDPGIGKGGRIVRSPDGLVIRALGPAAHRGSGVLYVVTGETTH